MSDDFEERLRAYGRTIDEATEADLVAVAKTDGATASSHPRWRQWRTRPLVAGVVIAIVAAIAVVAVVSSAQGPSDHVNVRSSTPTTPTTYYCDPNGGDTPTCPEEGPALTPQQEAQYATWLHEYPSADVARVRKMGFAGYPDAVIVAELEGYVACATTRHALNVARAATADQRSSAVDAIMQPELARVRQRNWPPQSAPPMIFERLTNALKTGDFDKFTFARPTLFKAECGHLAPLPKPLGP